MDNCVALQNLAHLKGHSAGLYHVACCFDKRRRDLSLTYADPPEEINWIWETVDLTNNKIGPKENDEDDINVFSIVFLSVVYNLNTIFIFF